MASIAAMSDGSATAIFMTSPASSNGTKFRRWRNSTGTLWTSVRSRAWRSRSIIGTW